MQFVHAGKTKLVVLGTWLIEDPRRVTVICTVVTTLVAVLALAIGQAHPGTLIGPNSEGTSGGG